MLVLFFSLIVFLFPLAYSPGPGNMFFAANGARFGVAATLPATLGYHIATWIVTAAIGFGFVATLENFPSLFILLKVAGSFYIFWIAWTLFKAGILESTLDAKPATFRDGVILLLLNPKAYFIIALMFSQFLDRPENPSWGLVIFITTVFTLNNFVAFSVWTLIGDKISGYFRSSTSAHKLNVLFGGILALVGVWMLIS